MTTLAEIFRMAMQDKGVRSKALARASGVPQRVIQRIMAGKTDPGSVVLEKLVAALDRF